MRILPLRMTAEDEAASSAGPAKIAFDANCKRAEALGVQLAEKQELHGAVVAALIAAEAKVAAPGTLREQLAQAEAELQATTELTGTPVDAAPLVSLQQQLAQAEREAAASTPRVRVERAKRERLEAEITHLRAAQRQEQAQHTALATECLWEDLSGKAAALTAARADYVAAFDAAFSTARAIDITAEAMKSGRFANSGAASVLVLPVVAGMEELPYSAAEHWQRLEQSAIELLRKMGLHS